MHTIVVLINFEFYKSMRSPISIQSRHFELRSSIPLVPLHITLSLKVDVYSSRRDQTPTFIIVKKKREKDHLSHY